MIFWQPYTMVFNNSRIAQWRHTFPITFNKVFACFNQGGFIPDVAAISYNTSNVTLSQCTIQGIAVDAYPVSGTASKGTLIIMGN